MKVDVFDYEEQVNGLIALHVMYGNTHFCLLAQRNAANPNHWEPGGDNLDAWCPSTMPLEAALEAIAMGEKKWG